METRKFKVLIDGEGQPVSGRIWKAESFSDICSALNLETGKVKRIVCWHITGPSGDINDPIDDNVSEEFLNELLNNKFIEEIKEETK
ncbi:hypothetical protein [Liquorilactobacillus hordei]|uniref:hypothetical protein n=1 Tax=Liquorilactobacillus hordei TaxID=468911 RepID=UPI001CBDB366|nr:hypothetical protein [Liquorilactobacillus hordei]MBZ2405141.1 hypothetical protein [Liquorilactobacillus hordei]